MTLAGSIADGPWVWVVREIFFLDARTHQRTSWVTRVLQHEPDVEGGPALDCERELLLQRSDARGGSQAKTPQRMIVGEVFRHGHVDGDFRNQTIVGCAIVEMVFKKAHFTDTTLYRSTILGSVFSGCDFSHVVFNQCLLLGCVFEGCDFNDVRLTDYVLQGVRLKEAAFERARLTNVEFRDCDLTNVDFTRARARDVMIDRACTVEGVRVAEYQLRWFINFEQHGAAGIDIDYEARPSLNDYFWLARRTMAFGLFKINAGVLIENILAAAGVGGVLAMLLSLAAGASGRPVESGTLLWAWGAASAMVAALIAGDYARSIKRRRQALNRAHALGWRRPASAAGAL